MNLFCLCNYRKSTASMGSESRWSFATQNL